MPYLANKHTPTYIIINHATILQALPCGSIINLHFNNEKMLLCFRLALLVSFVNSDG